MKEAPVRPKVSVVMAVYNGEDFLAEAVQSILLQTLTDFEFVIIDDGSQDHSREIIRAFTDPRIRLLCNEVNRGLAVSLNRGIAEARGEFIARMDHDDISLPHRLERQTLFLNEHPTVGLCGAWLETFGGPRRHVWRPPSASADIRMQLLFDSSVMHSTVMLRRELFLQHALTYDESFPCAQDYELWERASRVVEMRNIGEVLVRYRQHMEQTGKTRKELQRECADTVRQRALTALGITPDESELALHTAIATGSFTPSVEFLHQTGAWLENLRLVNQKSAYYDNVFFENFIGRKWWGICLSSREIGLAAYREYIRLPLHRFANLSQWQRFRFLGRCLLSELRNVSRGCSRLWGCGGVGR